jgi:hypothetical protein
MWCRHASGCLGSFVVGFPAPIPPAVLLWLCQSCLVESATVLPSGCIALLIKVPGALSAAFLALPSPQGGSRHESNKLPF